MDFELTNIEALAAQEGTVALALGGIEVGGRAGGIAATVTTEAGTMGITRLDGETEWIVDSLTAANGYPVFANGTGARYCRLKAVRDERIIAALDAAADGLAGGHDCQEEAVPYVSDGALGHGWECGVCGRFLQAG